MSFADTSQWGSGLPPDGQSSTSAPGSTQPDPFGPAPTTSADSKKPSWWNLPKRWKSRRNGAAPTTTNAADPQSPTEPLTTLWSNVPEFLKRAPEPSATTEALATTLPPSTPASSVDVPGVNLVPSPYGIPATSVPPTQQSYYGQQPYSQRPPPSTDYGMSDPRRDSGYWGSGSDSLPDPSSGPNSGLSVGESSEPPSGGETGMSVVRNQETGDLEIVADLLKMRQNTQEPSVAGEISVDGFKLVFSVTFGDRENGPPTRVDVQDNTRVSRDDSDYAWASASEYRDTAHSQNPYLAPSTTNHAPPWWLNSSHSQPGQTVPPADTAPTSDPTFAGPGSGVASSNQTPYYQADVEVWKREQADKLRRATPHDLQTELQHMSTTGLTQEAIDKLAHAASMRRLTESLPPETNITDAQHRDAILGQKWNPNHTARDRWDWATRGLGPGDEVMVDGRSHILDASDVLALATSRTSKFNEFAEQASQRFVPDEATWKSGRKWWKHRKKNRVPEESKMTSVEPLASNLVDLRDSGVAPWRKDGGGTDSEALDWFAKDKAKSYGLKSLPVVPAA